ncbi:MAG: hypothetical protein UY81_C0025G0003 [Candidatus Giovannonibacteria bacterium GW2011_GWA2_53_7]|uniref:Uncharacterized protein n=1 Tax=Candidatus Giovannonibacteria bacterium GW2011_GWA2_53_7 TaxID=1618650 RepID=A0A0G2AUD8_9BACT|nr:MAG: hypothetical protein UY81_C0025G0003 [Candidatus Giovannonibacteria bacterium GW2011_GWA2_53_7]
MSLMPAIRINGRTVLLGLAALGLILLFFRWLYPASPISPFFQAPGFMRVLSIEEAQTVLGRRIFAPKNLLGCQMYGVGVYTDSTGERPRGSTEIILQKNGWRFASILARPSDALPKTALTGEKILLKEGVNGFLQTNDVAPALCMPMMQTRTIGLCPIGATLAFEYKGVSYLLSADGTRATAGELVALAKSLISSIDEATAP